MIDQHTKAPPLPVPEDGSSPRPQSTRLSDGLSLPVIRLIGARIRVCGTDSYWTT